MVAFSYRPPSGVVGNVTRVDDSTITAELYNTSTPPGAFGLPVAVDANGVRPVAASDLGVNIVGMLVRPYPTSGNGTDGLGASVPVITLPASVLRRGYITAKLGGVAAAVKSGLIYVRVSNPSAGKVVGDVEAAGDQGVTASATVGTGTQTAGALSATQETPAGVYSVKMVTATTFDVIDANGAEIFHNGVFTTHYTLDNGLAFTMTSGGTPTIGDSTPITVAQNTFVMPSQWYFNGPADATGLVEVAVNI